MKILLYNWVNYDDDERRGGGVRIYHENLIGELTKDPANRVYTLWSGVRYDLLRSRVYIQERSGRDGVASYEVVNSPVAAPAHSAFHALDVYLRDTGLKAVVRSFLEAHGPFDVVQFDNLEGLTAGVLELKECFPETRFIYYMHNYNLLCPQVNLWFAESETCDDYNEGKRCVACLSHAINMREVKIAHAISVFLKGMGVKRDSFFFRVVYAHLALAKRAVRLLRRIAGGIRPERPRPEISAPGPAAGAEAPPYRRVHASSALADPYREYRRRNVRIANTLFDRVLVVSRRVGEIAASHGIEEGRIGVLYIGSRFAAHKAPLRVLEREHLKIAYLGYERRDKGFYHFVEALEAMPRSAARRISVLIAAGMRSSATVDRLRRLGTAFFDFEIVDGYEHRTLGPLLADVDLGVVPVLWEDNLPQVAIELVAHGVPILSSELGGAKELCGANPRFVYRHGDARDLINKILYFLDHRAALAGYADQGLDLMDMERHVRTLFERHYRAPARPLDAVPGALQDAARREAGL